MHRHTTRQLLAGAQTYTCLSCSLNSTVQGPFNLPSQSRSIVLPVLDSTVSKLLSEQVDKADGEIYKSRSKRKKPQQHLKTSQSSPKPGAEVIGENRSLAKKRKEHKDEGLLGNLERLEERANSILTALERSGKGNPSISKKLSLKDVNTHLDQTRRLRKEIQSRMRNEKLSSIRDKVAPLLSQDQPDGLATSEGSTERKREYLVDPSKSSSQPRSNKTGSEQPTLALQYLESFPEIGKGNGTGPIRSGHRTPKLQLFRGASKHLSPETENKTRMPFKMVLSGESATLIPSSDSSAGSQTPQSCRKRRDGIGSAKIETVAVAETALTPIDPGDDQPPVPSLAYGLDRVLFNPGVYHLQDLRSKVYNFDPYLQTIMPVSEFDFNSLRRYVTSSEDQTLERLAHSTGKKYIGSTSSLSSLLSHFHYLLSHWRPISVDRLSKAFPAKYTTFTELQRGPAAVFLKWQNGTYAIDADKELDTANVLSMLGKSMEKLLTLETDAYERYRRSNPAKLSDEEREVPEAYHFSTLGDFLIRSQLDAYDRRLPGTGMFDLKTRAVLSVRMNVKDYEVLKGYEIKNLFGEYESFEREYYDMIRAAFLKYSLQVRMGRMDGIFVAYHNTERIFGFQYIPLSEMDLALHGQTDVTLGDDELKHSFFLLSRILNKVTERFPEQSVRLHIETREAQENFMYIFAEPVTLEEMKELQSTGEKGIQAFEREVLGLHQESNTERTDVQRDRVDTSTDDATVDGEPVDGEVTERPSDKTRLSGDQKALATTSDSDTATPEEETSFDNIDSLIQENTRRNEPSPIEARDFMDPARSESLSSVQGSTIEEALKEPASKPPGTGNQSSNATTIISENRSEEDVGDELSESNSFDSSKPILGLTLAIHNKIDGKRVMRPEKVTENSGPWSVDYSLSEIPSQERTWVLYRMCQNRRKKALLDESNDLKYNNPFMRHIREMSQSRSKLREQQNKTEQENWTEPVIFEESRTLGAKIRQ